MATERSRQRIWRGISASNRLNRLRLIEQPSGPVIIFGGTSPFGTKTRVPVYVERSIFDLDKIYINGGKRGFLVEIDPDALQIFRYQRG